jgi:hypothetical protein
MTGEFPELKRITFGKRLSPAAEGENLSLD